MSAEKERVASNITNIEDRREQTHQSNLALVASLRYYEDYLATFTRPENYDLLVKETQNEVTMALAETQQLKRAVEGKVDREGLDEALDTMRQLREELQAKEADADMLGVLVARTTKSCESLEGDVAKLESQVTGLTPRPLWGELEVEQLDFEGKRSKQNIDELAELVKGLQKELMNIRDELPPDLQAER